MDESTCSQLALITINILTTAPPVIRVSSLFLPIVKQMMFVKLSLRLHKVKHLCYVDQLLFYVLYLAVSPLKRTGNTFYYMANWSTFFSAFQISIVVQYFLFQCILVYFILVYFILVYSVQCILAYFYRVPLKTTILDLGFLYKYLYYYHYY